MIIAIDLDSTIYPFMSALREVSALRNIKTPLNPNSWHFSDDLKNNENKSVSFNEFFELIKESHSEKVMAKYKPFPHSARVVNFLQEKSKVFFLSDNDSSSHDSILDWLVSHKFLSASKKKSLVITKDKRHWLKENSPEIVIDDRVRTMIFTKYELGAQAIGLQWNYNINLKGEVDGIHICKDWLHIEETCASIIEQYERLNK